MGEVFPKRYILHCIFPKEVQSFHENVIEEIKTNTGLTDTWKQGLSAHFTLKYWFETEQIIQIEELLNEFSEVNAAHPVWIAKPGHFNRSVIFYKISLSDDAKLVFQQLIEKLKTIAWMPWDRYDGENLHFHMTVAENCGDRFEQAWEIANAKTKDFECLFDNITILKMSETKDGVDLWEKHKTFLLRNIKT